MLHSGAADLHRPRGSTTTSLPITSPLCTHQLQTGPASLQRQMSLTSSCQNCKSWEKEGEKRAWLLPAGKQACSLQHRLGCAVCEGSQHTHQSEGVWSTLGRCTGEMGQWPQASHCAPAPALPPPAQCHRAVLQQYQLTAVQREFSLRSPLLCACSFLSM